MTKTAKPKPTTEPVATPTPRPDSVVINGETVFSLPGLRRALGLRESSLRREIREGRLRVLKRCGFYWFTGEAILEWLRAGEVKRRPEGAIERNGDH